MDDPERKAQMRWCTLFLAGCCGQTAAFGDGEMTVSWQGFETIGLSGTLVLPGVEDRETLLAAIDGLDLEEPTAPDDLEGAILLREGRPSDPLGIWAVGATTDLPDGLPVVCFREVGRVAVVVSIDRSAGRGFRSSPYQMSLWSREGTPLVTWAVSEVDQDDDFSASTDDDDLGGVAMFNPAVWSSTCSLPDEGTVEVAWSFGRRHVSEHHRCDPSFTLW